MSLETASLNILKIKPFISELIKRRHGFNPRASYTYRRLSAKLIATFADRRCRMVSAADLYCRNLDFLDWSRYFFFQVAPQLYSRG
jgi:hypothetical protein